MGNPGLRIASIVFCLAAVAALTMQDSNARGRGGGGSRGGGSRGGMSRPSGGHSRSPSMSRSRSYNRPSTSRPSSRRSLSPCADLTSMKLSIPRPIRIGLWSLVTLMLRRAPTAPAPRDTRVSSCGVLQWRIWPFSTHYQLLMRCGLWYPKGRIVEEKVFRSLR